MKLRGGILLSALGLVAVSACSHAAKSSSDAAPSPEMRGDVVIPARMTSGSGMARIRSVGSPPHGTVEIPVDADGRPNVLGIRFIGAFSEVTRRDIIELVDQATFVAARRNGIPEKGVVKMTFK